MRSYDVPLTLPVSLDVNFCLPPEQVTDKVSRHLILAIA